MIQFRLCFPPKLLCFEIFQRVNLIKLIWVCITLNWCNKLKVYQFWRTFAIWITYLSGIQIMGMSTTVTMWIPHKSGIQMFQTWPVAEWSGLWMMVWKPDKSLFSGLNVRYLNGPPNHVIRPFENRTKSVQRVECSDFRCMQVVSVFEWWSE